MLVVFSLLIAAYFKLNERLQIFVRLSNIVHTVVFRIHLSSLIVLNKDRVKAAGGHNMRDKATIKRLQMYRNFKPKR